MLVRRSRFVRFVADEEQTFDPAELLQGRLVVQQRGRISAFSALTRRSVEVDAVDLELIAQLSDDAWTATSGDPSDDERWCRLAEAGVVLSDLEPFRSLVHAHERIEDVGWHPVAVCTFLENQMAEDAAADRATGVDDIFAKMATRDADADRFVAEHGAPPPAFFELDRGHDVVPLAGELPRSELIDLLLRRRTCRSFDAEPLAQDAMATLLRATFGCFGLHHLGSRFVSLQRTSPSGGSMHPIEAFPIVLNVEGLESGFYHYRGRQNALAPLCFVPRETLAAQTIEFAQGQTFVGGAHVVVALVARFGRNMWKYRDRLNTYHVLWADAGHLAQTFQLVAESLGLGAFYTGALGPSKLQDALGVDPVEMGVLALCGLGVPTEHDAAALPFQAFDPETV